MGRKTSIDVSDKAMPFIQFLVDPVWKPMFQTFAELELSFVFVENTTRKGEEHRGRSIEERLTLFCAVSRNFRIRLFV